jgi:hypothetical protein
LKRLLGRWRRWLSRVVNLRGGGSYRVMACSLIGCSLAASATIGSYRIDGVLVDRRLLRVLRKRLALTALAQLLTMMAWLASR